MARVQIKRRKNIEGEADEFEILIDGHRINGVRHYTLSEAGGGIPVLTLEVEAYEELNTDIDFNLWFKDDGHVNVTLVSDVDDAAIVVQEEGHAA